MINILRLCAIAYLISMAGSTAVFAGSEKVDIDRVGDVLVNNVTAGKQIEPKLVVDNNNNNLYAVWADSQNTTNLFDIYFAKSTDNGASFSAGVRVNKKTPLNQTIPSIVVGTTGTIYCCWMSDSTNNPAHNTDIYFAKSTDGGTTFTPEIRVNNVNAGEQGSPGIAVSSSGNIYITWDDDQSTVDFDIYFTRSTNGGTSFTPAIKVSDKPADQYCPVLAVDNLGVVYVAWYDEWEAGPDLDSAEIRCARSTDNGATFGSSVLVNTRPGTPTNIPAIAVTGNGQVYVVWTGSGMPFSVMCNRSTNGGLTWGPNVNMLTTNWQPGMFGAVCVGPGGVIYAGWIDSRESGTKNFYYAQSTDGGASFGANTKLNVTSPGDRSWNYSISIQAAVTGKAVTTVWGISTDYRYDLNNPDIYSYSQQFIIGVEENQYRQAAGLGLVISPMPFVDKMEIRINQVGGSWTLKIYDAAGKEVKHWDSGTAGQPDRVTWYGEDASGRKLRAGIYFVHLDSSHGQQAKKAVLLQ